MTLRWPSGGHCHGGRVHLQNTKAITLKRPHSRQRGCTATHITEIPNPLLPTETRRQRTMSKMAVKVLLYHLYALNKLNLTKKLSAHPDYFFTEALMFIPKDLETHNHSTCLVPQDMAMQ